MKQEKKKVSRILWALTLVLMMLVTGVLGATEVQAAGIEAPTITKAFIGTNTISGGNLHRGKIDGKNARGTVHVTLKDSSGNEKATVSVTPKSGTTWEVKLPEGVAIAEGDTVTAYQEFDGQNSPVTTANAMDSLAKQNKDKLKMPTGEIWIEQTSSNQVNKDEQAEAVQMLKDANTAIAGDIKSVKFSIDTAEHAYYEVTYTDNTTSGKIEAPDLKIKQVTEYSRGATLGSITIVDNVIKGQLSGEGPFDGIKVQILLKLSDAVKDSYCDGGKCLVDKDTSDPVDATVDGKTGEFTYTIPNPDLKLDQKVGVTVKEPHKFKSCSQTTVQPVKVEKMEVKDPRKLTAEDKKAIDAAIRKGYTVNGESKLPNGTASGMEGIPAVIQIDDSGNVKIFSGNDVKGTWDSNYNFVPEKNEDGSYKVNEGAEPKITIPAKDLLKNIAPKSPAIKVDTDKGEVTITPPAYKDPGDDTDLLSYTITYKDNSGAEKTVTATRDLQTNKWSGTGVDADTGVITLSVEKIELAGTIKATAKDNGGLEGDTDKLDSDPATKTLETATVSYDANKGTGDMESKNLNKGSKYKLPDNKFTAPENKEFDGWVVNGEAKKVGDEITVNENTTVTAKWKDSMVDVTFAGNGGGGSMDKATVKKGSTYKLPDNKFTAPENKEFDGWVVNGEAKKAGDEITVTKDTTVTAKWKAIMVDITFDKGKGSGEKDKVSVAKGSEYTLPNSEGFTPPENQEFAGWKVGDEEGVKAPGTEITVSDNTKLTAVYRDKLINITFNGNGGTGEMNAKTVKKGEKYKLPDNTFVAPSDKQEFKAWEVDGKEVAPGTEITIDKDTVVKAVWKDKPSKPGGGGGVIVNNNQTPKPEDKKVDLTKAALNKEDHYQYLIGYEDDTFRAENNMTREEVAVMFSRLLKNPPVKGQVYAYNFPDVDQSRWSVTAISYMNQLGIVKGYPDGDFKPEASITRAEFAAMAARFADLQEGDKTFSDLDSSHWAYDVVSKAASAGWISGYPDGTFKADNPITRAEVVTITNKMLNRKADQDFVDRNLDKLLSFIDLNKDYWAYYPIVEATNGHDYIRSTNKVDEKWQEVTNKSFVYDK